MGQSMTELEALTNEIDAHVSRNSDLELSTLHLSARTAQAWWRLLKALRPDKCRVNATDQSETG
jgi:hypothetical protein